MFKSHPSKPMRLQYLSLITVGHIINKLIALLLDQSGCSNFVMYIMIIILFINNIIINNLFNRGD